ncbi:hypothetical protein ABTK14_23380, partial [Acinetobacter baumannii]
MSGAGHPGLAAVRAGPDWCQRAGRAVPARRSRSSFPPPDFPAAWRDRCAAGTTAPHGRVVVADPAGV